MRHLFPYTEYIFCLNIFTTGWHVIIIAEIGFVFRVLKTTLKVRYEEIF